MKVSRKLGRRKHSRSSSVSRRRLRNKKSRSGYKKRYAKTQKGGKRGRGQKRMRARTHKHGKRFHRGGVRSDLEKAMRDPDSAAGKRLIAAAQSQAHAQQKQAYENKRPAITTANGIREEFNIDSKESVCIYVNQNQIDFYLRAEESVIVLFKVKKEVIFSTTEPQKFYCIIRYSIEKNSSGVYIVRSFLILRRVDNPEIAFSVGGDAQMQGSQLTTGASNQQILAEKLKSRNFLEKMIYFKGNTHDSRILYDFSDPANIPIFNELAKIFEDTDYTKMALEKCGSKIGYSAPAPAPALAVAPTLTMEQKYQQIRLEEQEYKQKLSEEKEKINEQVKRLGDELEVTLPGQTTPVKFNDFKSELMQIAESSIQKITDNSNLTDEKKKQSKDFIELLLLKILLAQYKIMKKTYLLIKLKELNDTKDSPLYKQVTGYDNIDTNPFLGRMISDLLQNTENVKKIMEGLGDGTYDVPSKYLKDKDSLGKLSESLNLLDNESEQKTKLEQEIEELFTKVQEQQQQQQEEQQQQQQQEEQQQQQEEEP